MQNYFFLLERYLLRLETKHVGNLFCIGLKRSSYNALHSLDGLCVTLGPQDTSELILCFLVTFPELAEHKGSSPYLTNETAEEHILISCSPSRESGRAGIRISARPTYSFLK